MNILYRNHKWFLFNQNGTSQIQAKEPFASMLRSIQDHKMDCVLPIKKILEKEHKMCIFSTDVLIKANINELWKKSSKTQQEWLLYEYINVCLITLTNPSVDSLWLTNMGFFHTDWSHIKPVQSKNSWLKDLKDKVFQLIHKEYTNLREIFDSSPWSLYNFLQSLQKASCISNITEHPWYIRQEITCRSGSSRASFSLPPPVQAISKKDRADSLDDFSLEPQATSQSHSFPISKGSMIHSPVLQSFDNHLASKTEKVKSSVLHKLIRISSSLLS